MRQNQHSWSYLPLAKHFQITTERHYSAFLSLGHVKKISQLQLFYEAKYTLLFCLMKQNKHSWSYFATTRTGLAELVTWQVWTV